MKGLIYYMLGIFRNAMLSDKTIRKYIDRKNMIMEGDFPLEDVQMQPNSFDVRLSNKSFLYLIPNTDTGGIDPKRPSNTTPVPMNPDGSTDLLPHTFALASIDEYLYIPNGIVCFIQGRSSIARLAIQTEQAGLIDAGFCGTITLEMFNQSEYPITLYPGMRIAQLYFFRADKASRIYGHEKHSKYNGQHIPTESKLYKDYH